MNPADIFIAKQDLATFAKSDISMLAKQYNVSKIPNRDDLLWTLAIAIHLSSSRGTMDTEYDSRISSIRDAVRQRDINLLRSLNLTKRDIDYMNTYEDIANELVYINEDYNQKGQQVLYFLLNLGLDASRIFVILLHNIEFFDSPKLLLKLMDNYPIDVNYTFDSFLPPLFNVAMISGKKPAFKELFDAMLEKGANPNIEVDGATLLTHLIRIKSNKNMDIIETLLALDNIKLDGAIDAANFRIELGNSREIPYYTRIIDLIRKREQKRMWNTLRRINERDHPSRRTDN
jgi:hypothetical protein